MGILGVPCGAAGALAGVLEIFGSSVPWNGCGLFSPEALVFSGGSWIISSGFAGGLWVSVSPLMPWLCYWVLTGVLSGSACAAGLWLSRPFLDFLLGGSGKIQLTQIIQFAIYLHKVGNADAKCNEIQFSNNCFLFVNFLIIICKYVFSKLDYFVNVVFVVQRPIWTSHCNWKKKNLQHRNLRLTFSK